jgi:hypothetical protein
MRAKRGWRLGSIVSAAAVTAALLTAGAAEAAITIGSKLEGAIDIYVCPEGGVAATHSCGVTQGAANPEYAAVGGLVAPRSGIVVRWRLVTGVAPPGTKSISLRLRPLLGNTGGTAESSFVPLPLDQPGLHVFPARIPIATGERLSLDSLITNKEGETAGLPIVHYATDAGFPETWDPALKQGETRDPVNFPTSSYQLMFNADIEPDADHDGFGDETQDGCPGDASVHGSCPGPAAPSDKTPPQTKLTYPVRQDFLTKKTVLVRLRSNEDATAIASGQLEWPKGKSKHSGRVIYGLRGVKRQIAAGKKATLRLKLPKQTRKAALAASASGKRVVVKVVVSATDAAGNRSGATVATIKPKR